MSIVPGRDASPGSRHAPATAVSPVGRAVAGAEAAGVATVVEVFSGRPVLCVPAGRASG